MDSSGQLLTIAEETKGDLTPPRQDKLASMLSRANKSENEVVELCASFHAFLTGDEQWIAVARPVFRDDVLMGSLAVAHSLTPLYESLRQGGTTALVYLVINVIMLGVVGFFRMAKLIARPIERLVHLAEEYKETDALLFAAGDSGNEFDRLALSLNGMLSRIESDRKALQATVDQLSEANEQLRQNQQEMIRTEKLASVGRLAAGLAHEIGNPLGVIQGYLGLLGQVEGSEAEKQEYLARAEGELQRINALVRRLLDFARTPQGERELFSVHSLLEEVVTMIRVRSGMENIKIDCAIEAETDTVYADPDQLKQVLVNCLLNSADAVTAAHHRSGGAITLSTDQCTQQAEEGQSEFLRVRIRDNGVGIAEQDLALVFDPFFTTKEPGKGTGLGLSVSRTIVESMGGKIEMESEEGQGSVVSILLPIASKVLEHTDRKSI